MRSTVALLILLGGAADHSVTARANFVLIKVTAPGAVTVRAIWRPYAGAVGGLGAQQAAIQEMLRGHDDPGRMARWRDPAGRDTVTVKTPAQFDVDMGDGPVVVEVVGRDSVYLDAQKTPAGGPSNGVWGRRFSISAYGGPPTVERLPDH